MAPLRCSSLQKCGVTVSGQRSAQGAAQAVVVRVLIFCGRRVSCIVPVDLVQAEQDGSFASGVPVCQLGASASSLTASRAAGSAGRHLYQLFEPDINKQVSMGADAPRRGADACSPIVRAIPVYPRSCSFRSYI